MGKGYSRVLLFLQGLLALIIASLIIHTLISMRINGRIVKELGTTVSAISYLIVIVFSLVTHIVLRIKHRSHTPEGELLPLLFLFLTLECVIILPKYFVETGILIFDPVTTNVLIRFFFLSCSVMFIFTSLLYLGSNITQLGSFIATSLFAALVLSIMAPSSSTLQSAVYGFGSDYDVYFTFAAILVNLAAIVTYVVAAINDKVAHNIRRSITFIIMIIGNFGIFSETSNAVTITCTVLFIFSSILLITTSKDAF